MNTSPSSPLSRRRAGVLLHPTSLPGEHDFGDLGKEAYYFVDFLCSCGYSIWQMLPTGPTHGDRSPYQALSVFAGNPQLINIEMLCDAGCVADEIYEEYQSGEITREQVLSSAAKYFYKHGDETLCRELAAFVNEQAYWLTDYALFCAIRKRYEYASWRDWPDALRDRDADALSKVREELLEDIQLIEFEQFHFYRQWYSLKRYANERGVLLFGDMPIFVAYDSADVWSQRHYFTLKDNGWPEKVAGVPPDYFSETGQLWGNPLYRWSVMEGDGFAWWQKRMSSQLALFDWVRIDHFRGFEACWEIPGDAETAMEGHWVKAPGEALFASLSQALGEQLPLVAEDLGVITEEVEQLRCALGFPGMKILQFAFDSNSKNLYLPHNHRNDSIVYTGTHDNDTTLGWFESLDEQLQQHVNEYFGSPNETMPAVLIRAAMASVAAVAIVPMQDLLGLDGESRMNTPGTTEGNWVWRFSWEQVPENLGVEMRSLLNLYDRIVD